MKVYFGNLVIDVRYDKGFKDGVRTPFVYLAHCYIYTIFAEKTM